MNSGQVFDNLDEVVDRRLLLVAAAVLDLQLLGDFGHLLPAQVQKRLDEVAVDKTLNKNEECYQPC